MTLDTRNWVAAANLLKEKSSRTSVDFINGQALKVSIEAVRMTHKANQAQIEHQLGAVAREVSFKISTRGRFAGQMRTKKGAMVVKEDSLAERILGARRAAGLKEFGGAGLTLVERVRLFIASRKRSAGFIASGWIGARNALWGIVKVRPRVITSSAGAKVYGRPKGGASPARFSIRSLIFSEIENTALLTHSKYPSVAHDPMPVGIKGLQMALDFCAKDMLEELARRLNPDFKSVSAK